MKHFDPALAERAARIRRFLSAHTDRAAAWADLDQIEREVIARHLIDSTADSLRWDDAAAWARKHKTPLTAAEQRRADAISFDDDPESRIAAKWFELSPSAQARFRRAIGGER